jgi:molybdopterin molybdotransferase
MIGFDEACRRLAQAARPVGAERVSLDSAWTRILAAPIIAAQSAPRVAVSAMDGYAVREADMAAGMRSFRLAGESYAGSPGGGQRLEQGSCVRIFTGAPLPPGADRVIIQETVRREGAHILLAERPLDGGHVRAAGSDFASGEVLLDTGTVLTPQALVTAAAADCETIEAYVRPRVLVLSTGDELVAPGTAANTVGAIPESVSFGVAALARAWGGEVIGRMRVRDDLATLVRTASHGLDAAHIIVVTGGASVGERDFAKAMFEPLGLTMLFEKVAIKPGKPVWLGRVGARIILGRAPVSRTAARRHDGKAPGRSPGLADRSSRGVSGRLRRGGVLPPWPRRPRWRHTARQSGFQRPESAGDRRSADPPATRRTSPVRR